MPALASPVPAAALRAPVAPAAVSTKPAVEARGKRWVNAVLLSPGPAVTGIAAKALLLADKGECYLFPIRENRALTRDSCGTDVNRGPVTDRLIERGYYSSSGHMR